MIFMHAFELNEGALSTPVWLNEEMDASRLFDIDVPYLGIRANVETGGHPIRKSNLFGVGLAKSIF